MGSGFEITKATAVLFAGTFLLAAGMAGYVIMPLRAYERAALISAAVLMILPERMTDIIGISVGAAVILLCILRRRKALTEAKQ
jgi:TRAP-type uncharacterized transport system fused permease subunit